MHQRWFEAWAEGRTHFHRDSVDRDLVLHGAHLGPAPQRVLVPLCGKSHDLNWLEQAGHRVGGFELVPQAVEQWHAEQGRRPSRREAGPFTVHESGAVEIFEGDFLEADPAWTGRFTAAWDRASIVAMSREQRPAYAAALAALLEPGAPVLQITLVYDQDKAAGPPFSLPDEVVAALFPGWPREVLSAERLPEVSPRFAEAGVHEMTAVVALLRRP